MAIDPWHVTFWADGTGAAAGCDLDGHPCVHHHDLDSAVACSLEIRRLQREGVKVDYVDYDGTKTTMGASSLASAPPATEPAFSTIEQMFTRDFRSIILDADLPALTEDEKREVAKAITDLFIVGSAFMRRVGNSYDTSTPRIERVNPVSVQLVIDEPEQTPQEHLEMVTEQIESVSGVSDLQRGEVD